MRTAFAIAIFLCVGGVLIADPQVAVNNGQAVDTDKSPNKKEAGKKPATAQAAQPADESEEKPVSFWMEKKLEYSQVLLRGLATADFQAIATSGRQMRTLSRVEGFVRNRNSDYRAHLNTFRRVCDEIVRQADKENLEGATLAFNQLTVSCVSCHQSLRLD